ncbi:Major facilitator superfamily domain, general substrate transporter [Penicillium digitatum]|uniref:Major facilitator superfamily domain, general substrate transporter n=1 Tax=Penicillium digitatum TaxID=36651 RepID=A0A7T6XIS2_PENDI|nr:Major facilitator superfamily domain, general substrate transporter [Penicillium digitatum]
MPAKLESKIPKYITITRLRNPSTKHQSNCFYSSMSNIERITDTSGAVALGPSQTSQESQESYDDEFTLPTKEENDTLRKVADNLPFVGFSLCLVEFAERASYYGAQTLFSNFVQFPLPKGGNGAGSPPRGTQGTAGALGMGLQANTYIGRYKAIVIGVFICGVAHIIQVIGAIPSVLQKGKSNAAPPFVIGLLLLAFGAGLFKPNISPTVLDQHKSQTPYVKTLKSGENVIVDPETTNNRTMLLFYMFVNIGAFYMLATTYAEKYVGYWLSFLLSGIIYFLLPILLFAVYKKTKKHPPSGNKDLAEAFKIGWTALVQNRFQFWRNDFWDAAKPANLRSKGIEVNWTDTAVFKVAKTMEACDIFWFYPIYNLNDGGIGSVSTNQGASMITNGAPNDVLNNFNPLTIMVVIPILTFVIYPFLERRRLKPGPITRMTIGFSIATLAGIVGALVQWKVYQLSPCGTHSSTCDSVADISIWWQVPNTALSAISECFANVTAYEVAYARAPASMKGLVVAIFLFMTALSSALGEILIPAIKDPWLIWIWAAPAVALAVQTVIFWIRFRHMNSENYFAEDVVYSPVEEQQVLPKTEA